MFFVDSKRQITVIPTALTYTSSRNVFHDTTNNGIDYGSIIARKNGRLIDYATWRRFPTLIANCPLNEVLTNKNFIYLFSSVGIE